MKNKILLSLTLSSILFSTIAISAIDVNVKINNTKKKQMSEMDFFDMGENSVNPVKEVSVKKVEEVKAKPINKQSVAEIANIDNNIVNSDSHKRVAKQTAKVEYLNKKHEPKHMPKTDSYGKEIIVYINEKDYIMKSKKEGLIEKGYKEESKFAKSELKKSELDLEIFINKELQKLNLRLDTLSNDFKSYELELQKIIRSRANNRYAERTIESAKLELYDARDKHNLNVQELKFQIDILKRYPKKSKEYLLHYNNVTSKGRLLTTTDKEYVDLKKDYFENKFLLKENYYKKLEELKKKYRSNKKKLSIYYELRVNTLVNKIKGR